MPSSALKSDKSQLQLNEENRLPWDWDLELEREINALPQRSGARTRLRLIRATAELIAESDATLRPSAINRQARTAQGTFYMYFKDANEAEQAVLDGLLAYRATKIPHFADFDVAFEGIHSFVTAYSNVYAANAGLFVGLMRRIDHNPQHDPELGAIRQRYNSTLIEEIMADLRRRGMPKEVSAQTLELAIWATGTMLENTLYATLALMHSNRGVKLAGNLDRLVDTVSTLFYRALYAPACEGAALPAIPELARLGCDKSL